MAQRLNFATLNVRGLNDVNKRKKTIHYLKSINADVILLQETFCTQNLKQTIDKEWSNDYLMIHNCTTSAHSRGVSILFKKELKPEIIETYHSPDARLLLVSAKMYDNVFVFANLYEPNTVNARQEFFSQNARKIKQFASFNTNIFAAGDLNCVLTKNDRSSQILEQDISRLKLVNMINYLDVDDTMKHLGYTCVSKGGNAKSRLDYILFGKQSPFKLIKKEKLHFPLSDHKLLKVNVEIRSNNRGPGYWKFNKTLLGDECLKKNPY